MASSTTVETSSDTQVILTGEAQPSKGGFCYKFFDGDSFDGSNIPARWITKVLYGTDNSWDTRSPQKLMAMVKRYRWVDIIAEADADVTLSVEWMSGASSDEAVSRGGASKSLAALSMQLITADGNGIQKATSRCRLTLSRRSSIWRGRTETLSKMWGVGSGLAMTHRMGHGVLRG